MNDATNPTTTSADLSLDEVRDASASAMRDLLSVANVPEGGLVVLGCSSSEIRGGRIGTFGSAQIGQSVIAGIRPVIEQFGIDLAVQGCEHINRALVVEREYARRERLEIVSVVPAMDAGGSTSLAAYRTADDPVMVERVAADAGLDIGDTEIAQHVRFVQIPLRLPTREVGGARVTAVRSRPRLIGGPRAHYSL